MEAGRCGQGPSGVNRGIKLTCEKDYDPKKQCILCLQYSTEKDKLFSKSHGMVKIKTAAEIRRDVTVLDRLNSCSNFSYHLGNKCYKTYTHKRLLEAIEKERIQPELSTPPPATDENAITSPPRATRSKVSSARSLASPLITTKDKKYSIKCI